jgi:hypothetical protein
VAFDVTCEEGDLHEAWDNERAAQAAGVWHVHDVHPRKWLAVCGERPPIDPRPEELGSRV